jgi:putative flavoprotein involved in K+ transport
MRASYEPERIDTVVIGGGQAGLSVGYHLARRGQRFVILEANERVGDSWRQRWDSLRLFTPAYLDSLDGMPFPGPRGYFPTKDEMADYLVAYAKRFELPVRTGVRVTSVSRDGDRYVVKTGDVTYEASNVVLAMSTFQDPKMPAFSTDLDPSIVQLHSSEYKNLAQLRPGPVLLVGAGNSGAEIALETVRGGHETLMSGPDVGRVPFRFGSLPRRMILPIMARVVFHRVMTVDTPIGRKARPKMLKHAAPLIRATPDVLAAAGVQRVARTVGAREGKPVLQDDRVLDVANVIWCSGFHPAFSWIDLPVFDGDGQPRHDRGVVRNEPGLYFVGLHFLYAMSSTMIHGVGRDADYVAGVITSRVKTPSGQRSGPTTPAAGSPDRHSPGIRQTGNTDAGSRRTAARAAR